MTDNVLVPLPNFLLPPDLPWRVKFIDAVESHLRKLRTTGHFLPPRFFGYYFRGSEPVGVTGNWTVTLDPAPLLNELPCAVEKVTLGQFGIASRTGDEEPEFVLIHDRRDGACWLWRFAYGLRFVTAIEPLLDEEAG